MYTKTALYRSIAIRLLLITVISGFFLTSAGYSQKKKPKKSEKETVAPATLNSIGTALDKSDSLIVTEFKLPLIDSADDRPMFSLDGNIMVFGSRRPPM